MSRLDDELAKAVEESEASGESAPDSGRPVVAPAAATAGVTRPTPRRNLGLLAALLVMGGGILTLVMTNFEDAAVYSKPVDQLIAEKDKLANRNLKVQGTLVKGTLRRRDEPCEYRFKVEKNGQQLDVRYPHCSVPDTFRDMPDMDVDVTAEGKLHEEGYFAASHIVAKCPSKYEMKQRAQKGEAAPHDMMAPAPPQITN